MTDKVYKEGMVTLSLIARVTFSAGELKVFFKMLGHLSDQDFLSAIELVVKKEEFYPTTNYVALILNAAKSSNAISPAEAWGQLIEASQDWKKERDLDKTIRKTFNALGFEWSSIRPGGGLEATPKELGYMRREFIQFYKEYSESDETRQKLIGGSDANKRVGGGFQKIGGG